MVVTKCIVLLACLYVATSVPIKEVAQEPKKQKAAFDEVNGTRIDRPLILIGQHRINSTYVIATTNLTTTATEPVTISVASESNSNETSLDSNVKIYRIYDYAILSWMKDSYIMSFVIPIAVGIGCAITLIFLISLGRCVRNKCQRRHRKKFSNDTVRKMNLADRMKLLAETSDEEF